MIIEMPDDNSIVKWKKNDNDEWKSAEISDLIKAYEKRLIGEWINPEDYFCYQCSNCGEYTNNEGTVEEGLFDYCPKCGAKMKGDAE